MIKKYTFNTFPVLTESIISITLIYMIIIDLLAIK